MLKNKILILLVLVVPQAHGTTKIDHLKSAIRWTPQVIMANSALYLNYVAGYEYWNFKPRAVCTRAHNATPPAEAAVEIPKLRNQCLQTILMGSIVSGCCIAQTYAHQYESKILKGLRKTSGVVLTYICAEYILKHWHESQKHSNPTLIFILGTLGIGTIAGFFTYATYLA